MARCEMPMGLAVPERSITTPRFLELYPHVNIKGANR